jgi:DNA polymerase-3 subunit delta'
MPVPDAASAKIWLQEQGINDPERCLAEAGYSPLLALAVSDREYRARREAFLELLAAPDRLQPLGSANQFESLELPRLVDWLQRWCYDLLAARMSGGVRYHPHFKEKLSQLAGGLDAIALSRFQTWLTEAQRHATHTLNPKLFIEELLISYQLLFPKRSSGRAAPPG